MSDYTKWFLDFSVPMFTALVSGLIAWIFRGKIENQKLSIEMDKVSMEMDKLSMDMKKEEMEFRNGLVKTLMDTQQQLVELQKQVVALEQTVYQQALEIERLNGLLIEKDSKLKGYESNSTNVG